LCAICVWRKGLDIEPEEGEDEILLSYIYFWRKGPDIEPEEGEDGAILY